MDDDLYIRIILPDFGFTTGDGLEVMEASHFPGRGSITGLSILFHGPYTDLDTATPMRLFIQASLPTELNTSMRTVESAGTGKS